MCLGFILDYLPIYIDFVICDGLVFGLNIFLEMVKWNRVLPVIKRKNIWLVCFRENLREKNLKKLNL